MPLFINHPMKTFALASLGLLARVVTVTYFEEALRQRVEVTTPISDWKRAKEALYLWNSGLDPYSGNLFHEYPVSLQFYKIISNYFNVDLAYCLTDVITALLLHHSVYNQLILNDQITETAKQRSNYVLLGYLFSPLTIASCAGKSTTIFTNFLIAVICFILPMKPFRALTCVMCALLACNNIHYSTLIVPIFLCLEYCSNSKQRRNSASSTNTSSVPTPSLEKYYDGHNFFPSMSTSVMIFLTSVVTLISASYVLMGNSWAFLRATYLFVLYVQDLTPNIGMFWYLFTEMFENFIEFFTWVTQINAFIHVVPLSIYSRDEPFFALYITLLTSTIFQPYPNLANIGMIVSLLPQFSELVSRMQHGLKIICASVTCMCLWPIFWHLWIVTGTANSNFYFGATIAFMATLILFMIDLLNAHGYIKAKSKLSSLKGEEQEPSSNRS